MSRMSGCRELLSAAVVEAGSSPQQEREMGHQLDADESEPSQPPRRPPRWSKLHPDRRPQHQQTEYRPPGQPARHSSEQSAKNQRERDIVDQRHLKWLTMRRPF